MAAKRTPIRNTAHRPFRKDPATLGLMDTAYQLQKTGNLQQAELLYHKVLAAEPGNPFAIYALGTIALGRGDGETAVMLLRQALEAGYDHETVYTHLGIALHSLGRFEEAMAVYEAGAKKNPRNPQYHSNASVLLAQQGDFEGALRRVKRALKLELNFAPACMNAGFFLLALDRLVEAGEMFDRTLRLDPNNTAVQDALKVVRQKLASQGA